MRVEKEALARLLDGIVGQSSYLYFISYGGLTVAQLTAVREKLYGVRAGCHVMKNTMIRLALTRAGVKVPTPDALNASTALVFGQGDPSDAVKVILEAARTTGKVGLKGGVVDGQYLDAAQARAIADLPPKPVLYAVMLATVRGPATAIHRLVESRRSSVVRAVEGWVRKLEAAS